MKQRVESMTKQTTIDRINGEQGVGGASLCLSLPGLTVFAPGEASRIEGNSAGEARREHCVSTRVSKTELVALGADAKAKHKKLGALLREVYFDASRPSVPPVNLETWAALGDALEDLNLLAFRLNEGRLPENLRPVLADLGKKIHRLRADLVGQNQRRKEGSHER